MSRRDRIVFFERMELYISSGLTIDKALTLSRAGLSKKQKKTVDFISADVLSGSRFSSAVLRRLRISSTLAAILDQGEQSANLLNALKEIRLLIEREDDLVKKCLSAMVYPCVIGIFALVLTLVLMRGVMPQIVPMLRSLHSDLPLLTKIVIDVSDGLVTYGLILASLVIVLSFVFLFSYKKILLFRSLCQSVLLRFPIVGSIIFAYLTALFLRSLGSLITSGSSVHSAYSEVVSSMSFYPFRKLLSPSTSSIREGIQLASIFSNIKRLPNYVAPLASAGEITGSLGPSLVRCADILARDIDQDLKRLTSLIEPIMMAGLGAIVGCIAVSIMMPIYDISKVLQK